MSADLPAVEGRVTVPAVRVQVVFHVADDQQAQIVAAKMVDRAHEIANMPECECDVDISIERTRSNLATSPFEHGNVPPKF